MKALKWLLGDWRLWLIAGVCVFTLASLITKVPITIKDNAKWKSWDSSMMSNTLSVAGVDYMLFFGVRVSWAMSMSSKYDEVSKQMVPASSSPEPAVRVFQAPTVLAVFVMLLCSLWAAAWTRNRWLAWLWMTRFAAVSAVMYWVAAMTCLDPYDNPAYKQWTVSLGVEPIYTVIVFLVACGVTGGLAIGLAHFLPKRKVQQYVASATARAANWANSLATKEQGQKLVAAASSLGSQAVGSLQAVLQGGAASAGIQTGWRCCPFCRNDDPRQFGFGMFPKSGERCGRCHQILGDLGTSPNYPCGEDGCRKPMVVGARYCHNCGADQQAPVPPAPVLVDRDPSAHLGI